MLFDHDAKVSGDSARFADLPRGRQPRGVRPLGGWRDCPGLLRPGHGAGNLRAEKMRRMRAAGYWPSPTAWAAVPPGMETTLTVVLSSGGRSPRWLTSANPGRAGSAVVGSRDHRRAHDKRPRRRCLLLAAVLYGTWMAGQAFRLIRACGFCGPMAATCCAPADSARSSTTDRTFMYSLCAPHPPTRPPTDHRSRDPSQRVPVDPVPLCKAPACGVSRLPVPAYCRSWAPADQPR